MATLHLKKPVMWNWYMPCVEHELPELLADALLLTCARIVSIRESHEKKHVGCLGYVGDYTIYNHCKDPY